MSAEEGAGAAECLRNFEVVLDELASEGYGGTSKTLTGSERLCPYFLQAIEDCLVFGLYGGSVWWDCANQGLDLLDDSFHESKSARGGQKMIPVQVVEKTKASLFGMGAPEPDPRRWLVRMLNDPTNLLRTVNAIFGMADIVSAYYKPESVMSKPGNFSAFLSLLHRMELFRISLNPSDAKLFDERLPYLVPQTAEPILLSSPRAPGRTPRRTSDPCLAAADTSSPAGNRLPSTTPPETPTSAWEQAQKSAGKQAAPGKAKRRKKKVVKRKPAKAGGSSKKSPSRASNLSLCSATTTSEQEEGGTYKDTGSFACVSARSSPRSAPSCRVPDDDYAAEDGAASGTVLVDADDKPAPSPDSPGSTACRTAIDPRVLRGRAVADSEVQVGLVDVPARAAASAADVAALLEKEEACATREDELLAAEQAVGEREGRAALLHGGYRWAERRGFAENMAALLRELSGLQQKAQKAADNGQPLSRDVLHKLAEILQAANQPVDQQQQQQQQEDGSSGSNNSDRDESSATPTSHKRRRRSGSSVGSDGGASSGVLVDSQRRRFNLQTDEISHVERDGQLAIQGQRCVGCDREFKLSSYNLRRPRRCHYTGQLYCRRCHANKEHPLPSKIIQRWDFKPYKVCIAAHDFLKDIARDPVLHVQALNPNLYAKVPRLKETRELRIGLNKCLLKVRGYAPDVLAHDPHEYLVAEPDIYSLSDLALIQSKDHAQFQSLLSSIQARLISAAERISPPLANELMAILAT